MILKKTDFSITVKDTKYTVLQSETGRLFVRVYYTPSDNSSYREWHAMDMDTLRQRMEKNI